MHARRLLVALTGISLTASLLSTPAATAAPPVQVILNGQQLRLDPAPVILNDRTLVPLRGVFEAMGAVPHWDGESRTVQVTLGSHYVKLQIDRRLACLNLACTSASVLDVPAQIIENRTYVPIRFISTALGARVSWDDAARAVIIETDKAPFPYTAPLAIGGVRAGQVITGPVDLKATGLTGSQVRFYLMDPSTRTGRLIGAGADSGTAYTFTPDPTQAGSRLIIAAVKDESGQYRYSEPVSVQVAPTTKPTLTGITAGSTIPGPVTFSHQVQFATTHVVYRLIDTATGQTTDLATVGPNDPFTWYPPISANGAKQVQVLAYDRAGTEYRSDPVAVTVNSNYRTVFNAIKEGDTLTRPLTLSVAANYEIDSVRFLLDGKLLSAENNHWWKFGPEANGPHTMTVEVKDARGTVRTVGPIAFTINATPSLWLTGVGPKQVVTGEVALKATTNMPADQIKFFLREGGQDRLLGERAPGEALPWAPSSGGQKTIYAQAFQGGKWVLSTEPVTFQAYLGTVYKARPIVEKSQFKGFASAMAVKSHEETGMSAALQVAQGILETGWGQYVPVDKYTGQFSYNLFGMKGTGTAGSIISTTWEVYNGVSYTVDDYFRAYNNVQENWSDHKELLLTRSWYAPFRAVMTDPVLGAWGLKRSGYATDPQYPIKLINLMKSQGLFELDEVEL